MGTSLLCRMGYHKFGAWEEKIIAGQEEGGSRSPRKLTHKIRRCARCGLEHTDYSPQRGMQVSPPEAT